MHTKTVTRLFPFIMLLVLAGCGASNPLRIPDDQWSQMTPEQKLQAYEQQAELDKARIEAKAQERQAQIEADARKQEALMRLRQNARYGDWVQCVLEPLEVRYSSKWRDAKPVAFDLVKGETRSLRLQDRSERYSATGWVRFQDNGQTVSLCRSHSNSYGLRDCVELLGTTREFHRGIKKSIEVEKFLRGQIRCDLKRVP